MDQDKAVPVAPNSGLSSSETATASELASAMDEMKKVRVAATSLLEKAQGATVSELATAVEKAGNALKAASEFARAQAETRKLAQEEWKLKYENDTILERGAPSASESTSLC